MARLVVRWLMRGCVDGLVGGLVVSTVGVGCGLFVMDLVVWLAGVSA